VGPCGESAADYPASAPQKQHFSFALAGLLASNHIVADRLTAVLDSDGPALHALLWRLTLREDAAHDLLQELCVRLLRSDSFAAAESPVAFARRAAINLALDWRRRRRGHAPNDAIDATASETLSPLDQLEFRDDVQRILDAAAELSELSRECFVLRFVQDETYRSIGERTGKTVHQARALCHAAVRQIRTRLADRQVNHVR
jgi:RNA polymerase sigma-70 factor (ECF subfamily)